MTTVGANVLLFGGWDAVNRVQNDSWQWDGNDWTPLTPAMAPARASTLRWPRSTTGSSCSAAIGGNNVFFGDTWEWDGVAWTLRRAETTPPSFD